MNLALDGDRPRSSLRTSTAFTLIELLVVIAIIMLLAALLLSDVVIRTGTVDGYEPFLGYLLTQHFDGAKNLGGNLLRGDGSAEWYPWDTTHWTAVGNSRYDVQRQWQ